MTIIISQRGREVGMVTWNTPDVEHVTTTEGWHEDERRHRLDPAPSG
jgi:hypothetical protein